MLWHTWLPPIIKYYYTAFLSKKNLNSSATGSFRSASIPGATHKMHSQLWILVFALSQGPHQTSFGLVIQQWATLWRTHVRDIQACGSHCFASFEAGLASEPMWVTALLIWMRLPSNSLKPCRNPRLEFYF